MRIPAELRPEQVVAVVDDNERLPFDLAPLQHVRGTLDVGRYSVLGLEHVIAVHRRSLDELLSSVGSGREFFAREVQRMLAYPVRALVVEASWLDVERGNWHPRVTPASVVGSLVGWIAHGLPVVMAGDRARAGKLTSRLLFTAARRRWREFREMANQVHDKRASRLDTSGD